MIKALPYPIIIFFILLVGNIAANPPQTMSYQGQLKLSDGTPVPDDVYLVTFSIWNDSTSTDPVNQIWTSGLVFTPTVDGFFSIVLGEPPMPPITPTIFLTDAILYFGIAILPDMEISPRTPLSMTPFSSISSFSLNSIWADSAIVALESDHTKNADNAIWADSSVVALESDHTQNADSAAYLITPGANTGDVLTWDGANWKPDALAVDSISGGIASSHVSLGFTLVCDSMIDLSTVTITTPADGFIFVQGRTTILFRGTIQSITAIVQIDETPGGLEANGSSYISVGLSGYANAAVNDQMPVYVDRVYTKTAGTYTFRLEARACSFEQNAIAQVAFQGITAIFVPTSMGSVSPN